MAAAQNTTFEDIKHRTERIVNLSEQYHKCMRRITRLEAAAHINGAEINELRLAAHNFKLQKRVAKADIQRMLHRLPHAPMCIKDALCVIALYWAIRKFDVGREFSYAVARQTSDNQRTLIAETMEMLHIIPPPDGNLHMVLNCHKTGVGVNQYECHDLNV